MGAIIAIALNTFREAVRDRVLYSMLLFAVGLILFSLVLGEIAPAEQLRLTTDVGLAGISLMSVLLAIVLGVTNLHKEIDRKTVYFILPMPLARWQFLVGKFVGMAWVLLVTLAVMTGTLLTVLAWHDDPLQRWVLGLALVDVAVIALLLWKLRARPLLWPTVFGAWMVASGAWMASAAESTTDLVFQGACLVFSEAVLVTSIALLFSSFSTPFLSGVMTFLIFVAGRELQWLDALADRVRDPAVLRLAAGLEALFPNFYLFVPSVNVLEGRFLVTDYPMAPWALVGNAASYGAVYTAIVLGVAGLVLWRRDFV